MNYNGSLKYVCTRCSNNVRSSPQRKASNNRRAESCSLLIIRWNPQIILLAKEGSNIFMGCYAGNPFPRIFPNICLSVVTCFPSTNVVVSGKVVGTKAATPKARFEQEEQLQIQKPPSLFPHRLQQQLVCVNVASVFFHYYLCYVCSAERAKMCFAITNCCFLDSSMGRGRVEFPFFPDSLLLFFCPPPLL